MLPGDHLVQTIPPLEVTLEVTHLSFPTACCAIQMMHHVMLCVTAHPDSLVEGWGSLRLLWWVAGGGGGVLLVTDVVSTRKG